MEHLQGCNLPPKLVSGISRPLHTDHNNFALNVGWHKRSASTKRANFSPNTVNIDVHYWWMRKLIHPTGMEGWVGLDFLWWCWMGVLGCGARIARALPQPTFITSQVLRPNAGQVESRTISWG